MTKEKMDEIFEASGQEAVKASRNVAGGRARRIMRGVYTSNVKDPLKDVVARNFWRLVAIVEPGGVVAFKSAFFGMPTDLATEVGKEVFLNGKSDRAVELPGLSIKIIKGAGQLPGDMQFVNGLWMSSEARMFLQNVDMTYRPGRKSGNVSQEKILERLVNLCTYNADINKLRAEIQELGNILDLNKARGKLLELIDVAQAEAWKIRTLNGSSPRQKIRPDSDCVEMLNQLFASLKSNVLPNILLKKEMSGDEWQQCAFWDSYFSNYIEGTEFDVQEAFEIVFHNKNPHKRAADALDVSHAFQLASNRDEMTQGVLQTEGFDEFLSVIQRRHEILMAGRPEIFPGRWKTSINRAGSTYFVQPELVRSTLEAGYERITALQPGIARAIFLKFLLSQVHPFNDGNGRLSRSMMNAELISANLSRIIVPTGGRDFYIKGLKNLSGNQGPDLLIKTMLGLWKFSSDLPFKDWSDTQQILVRAGALDKDGKAGDFKFPDGKEFGANMPPWPPTKIFNKKPGR